MKRLLLLAAAWLAFSGLALAQHDTAAEVLANIALSGGVHYPYPTTQPAPTPAPQGYKAFYLSHIGRHGSRYGLGETLYTDMWKVVSEAHESGNLTAEGEAIYQAYAAIYPALMGHEGNLTQKGQQEHRYIATQIYRNYPSIFAGPTHASAVSTTSHRVLMSMFSFLDQLRTLDKDLDWDADYGYCYYPVILPDSSDSPAFVKARPLTKEQQALYNEFAAALIDTRAAAARWFREPTEAQSSLRYLQTVYGVVNSFENIDFPVCDTLRNMLTPDERLNLWRLRNLRLYHRYGYAPGVDQRRVTDMSGTVKDFIEKAEQDWKGGVALRLRFTHDSAIMPLLSYMGVNGMDAVVEDPFEIEKYWRTFDIPMAANVQLVFFKSDKNPEILVQVLLNGFEAALPFPQSVPGFYSWTDFKAYFKE